MLTLVLVILAPVAVIAFPQPYNGIVVCGCIVTIAIQEIERYAEIERKTRANETMRSNRLGRWASGGKSTDEDSQH